MFGQMPRRIRTVTSYYCKRCSNFLSFYMKERERCPKFAIKKKRAWVLSFALNSAIRYDNDTVRLPLPQNILKRASTVKQVCNLNRYGTCRPLYQLRETSLLRILHECEVLIEKSVQRDTVWHHEAPPSDAKL